MDNIASLGLKNYDYVLLKGKNNQEILCIVQGYQAKEDTDYLMAKISTNLSQRLGLIFNQDEVEILPFRNPVECKQIYASTESEASRDEIISAFRSYLEQFPIDQIPRPISQGYYLILHDQIKIDVQLTEPCTHSFISSNTAFIIDDGPFNPQKGLIKNHSLKDKNNSDQIAQQQHTLPAQDERQKVLNFEESVCSRLTGRGQFLRTIENNVICSACKDFCKPLSQTLPLQINAGLSCQCNGNNCNFRNFKKQTTPEFTYYGELKGNKKHGQGSILFIESGNIFKGQWGDDEPSNGMLWNKSEKSWSIGTFKNFQLHGDFCSIHYAQKQYLGPFKHGLLQEGGMGSESYPNGQHYEGNMCHNSDGIIVKHGQGIYIYKKTKNYQGEFNNGQVHGKGILYSSQYRHQGTFQNGKILGYGVRYSKDRKRPKGPPLIQKGFWDKDQCSQQDHNHQSQKQQQPVRQKGMSELNDGKELSLDQLVEEIISKNGWKANHKKIQHVRNLRNIVQSVNQSLFPDLYKEQSPQLTDSDQGLAAHLIPIYQQVHLLIGNYPRNIQTLAVLLLFSGDKCLAQILPSEGKTIIIAMLSVLLMKLKKQKVDIITSSDTLCTDNQKELQDFYTAFQITSDHAMHDSNTVSKERIRQAYKSDIIYTTAHKGQADYLQDIFFQKNLKEERPFSIAIVDEVDNMFIDRATMSCQLSYPQPGLECVNTILFAIYKYCKDYIICGQDFILEPLPSELFQQGLEALFIEQTKQRDDEESKEEGPDNNNWHEQDAIQEYFVTLLKILGGEQEKATVEEIAYYCKRIGLSLAHQSYTGQWNLISHDDKRTDEGRGLCLGIRNSGQFASFIVSQQSKLTELISSEIAQMMTDKTEQPSEEEQKSQEVSDLSKIAANLVSKIGKVNVSIQTAKPTDVNINKDYNDLESKLRKQNLCLRDSDQKGNSLFTSVCELLEVSKDSHQSLRESIANQISSNEKEFLVFFNNTQDFKTYTSKMTKKNNYAGNFELAVLSKIFNCRFIVHQPGKLPDIVIDMSQGQQEKHEYHLGLLQGCVYRSIVELDDSSSTIDTTSSEASGQDQGKSIDQAIDRHKQRERPRVFVPLFLQSYIKRKLKKLIYNAMAAGSLYFKNQDYIIEGNQIVIVDLKNTGELQNNMVWQEGLTMFIHIKENLPLLGDGLSSTFISNEAFFRKYETIYGVSGTLGTDQENEFLQKSFDQIELIKIPPFKRHRLVEIPPRVVNSPEQWIKLVEEAVQFEAVIKKRSILIICESIKSAETFQSILTSKVSKVHEYWRSDNQDQKELTKIVISPGEVIVATNLGARGTDFKQSKEVEENGGMFVIMTFIPPCERIKWQAFYRTARAGAQGSAQIIAYSSIEGKPQDIIEKFQDDNASQMRSISINILPENQWKQRLFNLFYDYHKDFVSKASFKYSLEGSIEKEALRYEWCMKIDEIESEDLQKTQPWKQIGSEQIIFKDFVRDFESRILKDLSQNPFYKLKKGNAFVDKDDTESAIEWYNKMIHSCNNNFMCAPAYLFRGYCALKKDGSDAYTQGINDFKTGMKKIQESIDHLMIMAVIATEFGAQPLNIDVVPKEEGEEEGEEEEEEKKGESEASSNAQEKKVRQEKVTLITPIHKKIEFLGMLKDKYQLGLENMDSLVKDGKDIAVTIKPLSQLFTDTSYGSVITELEQQGFMGMIEVSEKPPWWGPLVVGLIGLAQIALGAVLVYFSGGLLATIGKALIEEGVSDIIFAVQSGIEGNFSWKNYGINKAISIGTSILTFGVGRAFKYGKSFFNKGAQTLAKEAGKQVTKEVTKQSLKQFAYQAGKYVAGSVCKQGVKMVADQSLKYAVNKLLGQLKTQIDTKVTASVSKFREEQDFDNKIRLVSYHMNYRRLSYENQLRQLTEVQDIKANKVLSTISEISQSIQGIKSLRDSKVGVAASAIQALSAVGIIAQVSSDISTLTDDTSQQKLKFITKYIEDDNSMKLKDQKLQKRVLSFVDLLYNEQHITEQVQQFLAQNAKNKGLFEDCILNSWKHLGDLHSSIDKKFKDLIQRITEVIMDAISGHIVKPLASQGMNYAMRGINDKFDKYIQSNQLHIKGEIPLFAPRDTRDAGKAVSRFVTLKAAGEGFVKGFASAAVKDFGKGLVNEQLKGISESDIRKAIEAAFVPHAVAQKVCSFLVARQVLKDFQINKEKIPPALDQIPDDLSYLKDLIKSICDSLTEIDFLNLAKQAALAGLTDGIVQSISRGYDAHKLKKEVLKDRDNHVKRVKEFGIGSEIDLQGLANLHGITIKVKLENGEERVYAPSNGKVSDKPPIELKYKQKKAGEEYGHFENSKGAHFSYGDSDCLFKAVGVDLGIHPDDLKEQHINALKDQPSKLLRNIEIDTLKSGGEMKGKGFKLTNPADKNKPPIINIFEADFRAIFGDQAMDIEDMLNNMNSLNIAGTGANLIDLLFTKKIKLTPGQRTAERGLCQKRLAHEFFKGQFPSQVDIYDITTGNYVRSHVDGSGARGDPSSSLHHIVPDSQIKKMFQNSFHLMQNDPDFQERFLTEVSDQQSQCEIARFVAQNTYDDLMTTFSDPNLNNTNFSNSGVDSFDVQFACKMAGAVNSYIWNGGNLVRGPSNKIRGTNDPKHYFDREVWESIPDSRQKMRITQIDENIKISQDTSKSIQERQDATIKAMQGFRSIHKKGPVTAPSSMNSTTNQSEVSGKGKNKHHFQNKNMGVPLSK